MRTNLTRWFTFSRGLTIYKRDQCSRGICNIRNEGDAREHLRTKCITNIEYVEALGMLKEINKNA
jgi:hypothetical protein